MNGVINFERLVAEYRGWLKSPFPFNMARVKVYDRNLPELIASINVAIRDVSTGSPEFIGGYGKTPDEALRDLLENFMSEVQKNMPTNRILAENDFEWAAFQDF